MKILIRIIVPIAFFMLSLAAYAQSPEEIAMARAMAKQYGYTESEINAMMNDKQESGSSKDVVRDVDRNVEVAPSQVIVAENASNEGSGIYGHNLFSSSNLNFIPNYNLPTPANYKLAPGDEVVLDIWGATSTHYSKVVSPEGSITIEYVGPIYLTGYTIEQVEKILRERLSTIYSGMSGDEPTTFLRVTLGKIRSLSINVVGDVATPGTFTLPSLSTVFTAVYLAGGPTNLGSLRNVRVYRQGKLYKTIDYYDFLINGNSSDNERLEDNDLIIIPPYETLVSISGSVKRPMYYELNENETIADLIQYAAGFSARADISMAHVERVKGERTMTFDVEAGDFHSFILENGDKVHIRSNIERDQNIVSISGGVWFPGNYSITEDMSTLKALIEKAGGLREEAYLDRGYMVRLDEVRDTVAMYFNVVDVVSGSDDIQLRNEDRITIFTNSYFNPGYSVVTQGQFNNAHSIAYRKGITLGDAITLSGGFTIGASSVIEIARRNFYDKSLVKRDTTAIIYLFDLEKDTSAYDFLLEPYDIITSRRLPNYVRPVSLRIVGEVNFPGYYVSEKRVVRLSELVEKAGGYTENAYLEGTTITRLLSDEEYERAVLAAKLTLQQPGVDESMVQIPDRNTRYKVGFDMKKALKEPGSIDDIILEEGDIVEIPQYTSTVKLSGAVMFPNIVAYSPSMSIKKYIKQAGGYTKLALRGKKYIVFMNGQAATKGSRNFKPMPGCEIIVPFKEERDRKRISASEVVSIATSTASLATMVITMTNILTK